MKIEFYKINGEKDTPQEYPKELVSEVSDANVLEYIRVCRANARQVLANTKDRSEVSGGGKKPWRQKGTGRARAGSSRSPIWIGGGVTFGPTTDRNFSLKLNKRQKRSALLSILTTKVNEKNAIGISNLKVAEPKTKIVASALANLPLAGKSVIFLSVKDEAAKKSFSNIPFVRACQANSVDVVSLVSAENIIFTKESLKELANHFSGKQEQIIEKVENE